MKICIKKLLYILLTVLFPLFSPAAIRAALLYNDVPADHPAYGPIARIAQKGILVGDTSGNYRPDDYIDKFDAAKILANLAGYKLIEFTEAEKLYYERAYEANKELISQYGKRFKKWNAAADREIAFLIEKDILTPEDLNQFVVLRDGEEAVRALSNEEAMVYLVKLMGKKSEALSAANLFAYADDIKITAAYKPYVYYMKNAGLTEDSDDNDFNPKQAVTRADMAVLLDKAIIFWGDAADVVQSEPPPTDEPPTGLSAAPEIITGVFDKLFESETGYAMQIIKEDGVKELYKISAIAAVKINGVRGELSGLTQGAPLKILLNNLYVMEIDAGTADFTADLTAGDDEKTETGAGNAGPYVDGVVDEIRRNLTSAFIRLNTNGALTNYTVNNKTVDLSQINPGARVRMFLEAGTVYAVSVRADEYAKTVISGFIKETGFNYFTVDDIKNGLRGIYFNESTAITDFQTGGRLSASDIQVGVFIYIYHNDNNATHITVIRK